MNEEYLAHHGILGQRWGIRRFQPYSTTGARKSGKPGKEIGLAAKSRKKQKPEKTPEEKQQEFEASKQHALKFGGVDDILKFQGHLTVNEMQSAIDRIKKEDTLRELKRDQSKQTINRMIDKVNTAKSLVKAVKDVNDTVKSVKDLVAPDKAAAEKKQDLATKSLDAILSKYGSGKLSIDEMKSVADRFEREAGLRKLADTLNPEKKQRAKDIDTLSVSSLRDKYKDLTVSEMDSVMKRVAKERDFETAGNSDKQSRARDIETMSAGDLLNKYGYGNLSINELETALKRMKKEHELENISKGIWDKNDKQKKKDEDDD